MSALFFFVRGLMDNQHSHPSWIKTKFPVFSGINNVKNIMDDLLLHSVCVEASCPNKGECWREAHVTFMILGKNCSRSCLFCDVEKGEMVKPDITEPKRIAEAVKALAIKYCVITSVTRDDLEDKGAGHFVKTVQEIKKKSPETLIELLIPDMAGDTGFLKVLANSGANVIGHNLEMPKNLYPAIRTSSSYKTSLKVLKFLSDCNNELAIKSAIMVGFGESIPDIKSAMTDLIEHGVNILYIGQYLSPSKNHWPVKKFYTPREFQLLEESAKKIGFTTVLSAPLVRSSYKAREKYLEYLTQKHVLLSARR
ncbi:lipoyl synthase [Candidatus Omnitrophus magneticus]|uniref:Lipoyl synthase n=1 Tax=Candidatus Omnitrophus magneticus TaxID=1609969 RepID=A0A0F0CL52_9BACT|nr:lipoyl synthase [Candidatus Omnitrophus magneticus]